MCSIKFNSLKTQWFDLIPPISTMERRYTEVTSLKRFDNIVKLAALQQFVSNWENFLSAFSIASDIFFFILLVQREEPLLLYVWMYKFVFNFPTHVLVYLINISEAVVYSTLGFIKLNRILLVHFQHFYYSWPTVLINFKRFSTIIIIKARKKKESLELISSSIFHILLLINCCMFLAPLI